MIPIYQLHLIQNLILCQLTAISLTNFWNMPHLQVDISTIGKVQHFAARCIMDDYFWRSGVTTMLKSLKLHESCCPYFKLVSSCSPVLLLKTSLKILSFSDPRLINVVK